jgi:hypothetical protein
MKIRQYGWLLIILLLAAMLLPLWIGPYAPLYDYPNHLLEAQVVAQYTNPQLGYANHYEINPDWYLRSNALSTLLLIGLGQLMPITLAGQLVLSLYMLLFVGGLAFLLQWAGTTWPLLLLAPTLAYNFAFTSGWLNFCYGMALGLYALVLYIRWQEQDQRRYLLGLAFLLLLIYMAHLMVWLLLLMIFTVMATVEAYHWRRHSELLLALNSALPLLLITRPTLALGALLLAPMVWGSVTLLRRLHLSKRTLAFGAIGVAGLTIGAARVAEPLYQAFSPELEYAEFDKITFPLRLFTLPHQFLPPDTLLIIYNLLLLALILALSGLLVWSTWHQSDQNRSRWLVALGLLSLLYLIIPSRTSEIWITEPRILLLIIFIALAAVRLPIESRLRHAVIFSTLSLCLLSIGGTIRYAQVYDQQARLWRAQMAMLTPARRVLLLRENSSVYIKRPTLLGSFNRFYTGEFFSTVYTLEYGGFASRTFNNGPVRPRQTISIPAYDWPHFRDNHYVAEHCATLRETYDAVLFWGRPDPNLITQLDDCFVAGPDWPNMAIWRVK